MSVKPLTGMVLIEVIPPPKESPAGVALPGDVALSAEIVQERSHNPEKPPAMIGTVKAIGGWPRLKNGMALLPEFGIGAKVAFSRHLGTPLERGFGQRLRMIRQEDVLAVLS